MSLALHVILSRSRMPTPEVWRGAIHDLRSDVELTREFDPFSFAGFLPCPVGGREAGFEYYFEESSLETLRNIGVDPNRLGKHDAIVSFIWGSREDDCTAATFSAAALSQLTDGALVDVDSSIITPQQAAEWAQDEPPPPQDQRDSFQSKRRSISPITYISFGAVLIFAIYRCAA